MVRSHSRTARIYWVRTVSCQSRPTWTPLRRRWRRTQVPRFPRRICSVFATVVGNGQGTNGAPETETAVAAASSAASRIVIAIIVSIIAIWSRVREAVAPVAGPRPWTRLRRQRRPFETASDKRPPPPQPQVVTPPSTTPQTKQQEHFEVDQTTTIILQTTNAPSNPSPPHSGYIFHDCKRVASKTTRRWRRKECERGQMKNGAEESRFFHNYPPAGFVLSLSLPPHMYTFHIPCLSLPYTPCLCNQETSSCLSYKFYGPVTARLLTISQQNKVQRHSVC